jgi:hypothetical protein
MDNPQTGSSNAAGTGPSNNNGSSSTNDQTGTNYSIEDSLNNYDRLNKDLRAEKNKLSLYINRFRGLIQEMNDSLGKTNNGEQQRKISANLSLNRQRIIDKCALVEPLSNVRDSTLEQLKAQHLHYNVNLQDFRFKSHKNVTDKSLLSIGRRLVNRSL